MKAKLAKLIDVKSIVTLILTGVFAYLAIIAKISAGEIWPSLSGEPAFTKSPS